MIKYKYQLLFLLIAGLNCLSISAKAYTENQPPPQGSIGSAHTGYDVNGMQLQSNPDSDTSNASVYQGAHGYPGMPVNGSPLADEYAANIPDPQQPYDSYQSQTYILPAQNLPPNFRAKHTFSLPNTSTRLLTPVERTANVNAFGLPPTILDSFVEQAGGERDNIYGDEGTTNYPQASNFGYISSGFHGQTKKGLTTGHGSRLPSAWGDGWSDSARPIKPSLATTDANSTDVNEAPLLPPTN